MYAIEPPKCKVVERGGIKTINESVLDGIGIKTSRTEIVIG